MAPTGVCVPVCAPGVAAGVSLPPGPCEWWRVIGGCECACGKFDVSPRGETEFECGRVFKVDFERCFVATASAAAWRGGRSESDWGRTGPVESRGRVVIGEDAVGVAEVGLGPFERNEDERRSAAPSVLIAPKL